MKLVFEIIFVLILGAGIAFLFPWFLYICSYMIARGRWNAIRDSKLKSSLKNLQNLTEYGKEN